jgi:hypothetical protein
MDDRVCIDWSLFELRPGITETLLLDVSATLQREFLDQQPGFVQRQLVKSESGQWVDLVVWSSRAAAESAAANAAGSEACHDYLRLMAGPLTATPDRS